MNDKEDYDLFLDDDYADFDLGMMKNGKEVYFYKYYRGKSTGHSTYWYDTKLKKNRGLSGSMVTLKSHWNKAPAHYTPIKITPEALDWYRKNGYERVTEVDENGKYISDVRIAPISPIFTMPAFPTYTVPDLPEPPVAWKDITDKLKELAQWYQDVTVGGFSYTHQDLGGTSRTVLANGIGQFFIKGATNIGTWYPYKSGCGLNVGCIFKNVKNAYNGIIFTRGFLSYASKKLADLIARGMKLNKEFGEMIIENMKDLPEDIQDWFLALQQNYSKALKDYSRDIQKQMLTNVNKMRESINKAFTQVDKEFKKIIGKYTAETQKALQSFKNNLDAAKKDFNKQTKDIKAKLTKATTDFNKNIKTINAEIKKAKESMAKITKDVTNIKKWSQTTESRLRKLEEGVKKPSPFDITKYVEFSDENML